MSNAEVVRNAGIYVRISEDRAGARLGVERQAADCRELAERLGWHVVEVYEDNDISAYSGKPRPGYKRLMDAIERGAVDAVLAWHPDRLHRRPIELEAFINLVESRHVAIATVQAGEMDLATPSGRLVARQLGSVARYESEHKSERIKRAFAQRRESGQSHAGRRVYGYDGSSHIIKSEAEHVRWAVGRLCDGVSWNEVVRGLERRGAVTDAGTPIDRHGLKRILTNPRLRGQLTYNGQVIRDGNWPAIISMQQWAVLRSRVHVGLSTPGRPIHHLLSGILRCGKCGMGLVHGPARIRPRPGHATYWCIPTPGGLRRGCGGTVILQPLADAAVKAIVIEALGNVRATPHDRSAVGSLEAAIGDLRQRQREIAAALAEGKLSVLVASEADMKRPGFVGGCSLE